MDIKCDTDNLTYFNIYLTEQCIAIWRNTWQNRSDLCYFELFWFIQMQAISRPILDTQKKEQSL